MNYKPGTQYVIFLKLCFKVAHLDMTITLFFDGIQRSRLILARVPICMQILLMSRSPKLFVHAFDDLLIGATLEWH
jgi:hypothetical protein